MAELSFQSRLSWSGGRQGTGQAEAGSERFAFSVPASMGGLGLGTNPEELLLSAVGSCYTATLAGILEASRLPVEEIRVRIDGEVSDYPSLQARVSRIVVNPTFLGGEVGREGEYEAAARNARERCFIGRHLGSQTEYEVGEIEFTKLEPVGGDVLDVRALPPPRRHQLIFGRLEELGRGAAITLINDHDPKPLYYQLEATQPGHFSWDYLEEGPEAWRVRIARIA